MMKTSVEHNGRKYSADLSKAIDISLPISNTDENPIAWYIERPSIEPVVFGTWIGEVKSGASTNFRNITFNPHGHGTHTECLGHITREDYSINKLLNRFFFFAELITIEPDSINDDLVITKEQVKAKISGTTEALIIRTLPNDSSKKSRKYSNTNPPYLESDAAKFINECGIKHLLIDLPSVDREHDEGKLLAHKAFWNVNNVDEANDDANFDATITEMIFVDDRVADGLYLLNLQIASFENDATPSKPILFELREI